MTFVDFQVKGHEVNMFLLVFIIGFKSLYFEINFILTCVKVIIAGLGWR